MRAATAQKSATGHLVDEDVGDGVEVRVALEAAEEHARGDREEAGPGRPLRLQPHRVPHRVAFESESRLR